MKNFLSDWMPLTSIMWKKEEFTYVFRLYNFINLEIGKELRKWCIFYLYSSKKNLKEEIHLFSRPSFLLAEVVDLKPSKSWLTEENICIHAVHNFFLPLILSEFLILLNQEKNAPKIILVWMLSKCSRKNTQAH